MFHTVDLTEKDCYACFTFTWSRNIFPGVFVAWSLKYLTAVMADKVPEEEPDFDPWTIFTLQRWTSFFGTSKCLFQASVFFWTLFFVRTLRFSLDKNFSNLANALLHIRPFSEPPKSFFKPPNIVFEPRSGDISSFQVEPARRLKVVACDMILQFFKIHAGKPV